MSDVSIVLRVPLHRTRCCLCVNVQVLCRLGEETISTPVYAQIDRNECYIMTETALRTLALVGEPTPGAPTGGLAGKTFKVLRLAAFGPATLGASDYNLRIYVIEDTHDAFQVIAPRYSIALYYIHDIVLLLHYITPCHLL